MKLRILNENCTSAGRQADRDRDYDECADVTVFEGTPHELLELATLREKHARSGGGGAYDRRVAATIREAILEKHPELADDK